MLKSTNHLHTILTPILDNCFSNLKTILIGAAPVLMDCLMRVMQPEISHTELANYLSKISQPAKTVLLYLHDLIQEYNRPSMFIGVGWIQQEYLALNNQQPLPSGVIKAYVKLSIERYCQTVKQAAHSSVNSHFPMSGSPLTAQPALSFHQETSSSMMTNHSMTFNINLDVMASTHPQPETCFSDSLPSKSTTEFVQQGSLFYNQGRYAQAHAAFAQALLLATQVSEIADIRHKQELTEQALHYNYTLLPISFMSQTEKEPSPSASAHREVSSLISSSPFSFFASPTESFHVKEEASDKAIPSIPSPIKLIMDNTRDSSPLNIIQVLFQQAAQAYQQNNYVKALHFNRHALYLQQEHHFDQQATLLQRASILKSFGAECFTEAHHCEDKAAKEHMEQSECDALRIAVAPGVLSKSKR
jgi:tetratricopeptide (TPR) repeat protein